MVAQRSRYDHTTGSHYSECLDTSLWHWNKFMQNVQLSSSSAQLLRQTCCVTDSGTNFPFTHIPTPPSKVPCNKLRLGAVVEVFPASNRTRRFTTVFTKASVPSSAWVRRIQSAPWLILYPTPPWGSSPPPSGPGSAHYRGFTITFRHTTLMRTPLDEWSALNRYHYLTIHTTFTKRQISMSRRDSNPQNHQSNGRRSTP